MKKINSTDVSELLPEHTPFEAAMLKMAVALNASGQHIYGGTANPRKVAKRRAKNKVAKRSRRVNRR